MAIQKFCAMVDGNSLNAMPSQPPLPSATVSPCVAAAAKVPLNRPEEGAVAGGALPEHPEQERGEQRRIHESEHQLQQIHDVVVLLRQVGRRDRERDADDRGQAAHREVMRVGGVRRM